MDRYQKRVLRLRNHVQSHSKNNNEDTQEPTKEVKEVANVIAFDDITKTEISEILAGKDIEHNSRDTKQALYDLLLGSD